ncbi:hypothetical protein [Rubrobacter indicoceani]|uniref:hypothetical protein n=1 Tax=Rubrobacter indicoceani TaxID=2051957 RepID=UPI001968CCDF|nr:hypothetical protein [Rubrobacter indicoceani]
MTTVAFSVALAITCAIWCMSERTLSVHSIRTPKRKAFYWLAILFTFALVTATDDPLVEGLALGFLPSALLFARAIGLVALAG